MNLILLGAPGSGKGTQAQKIVDVLGLTHLSTGNIFREEISKGTPLGVKVSAIMNKGELVPDDVVVETVGTKISGNGGYLFDGFPRTIGQAVELDKMLDRKNLRVDKVVLINITDAEVVRRIGGRRSCSACGKVYNVSFQPTAKEGVCDACGAQLQTRADDKEETIKERLLVYHSQTAPLVEYYRKAGVLEETDGALSPSQVSENILGILNVVH